MMSRNHLRSMTAKRVRVVEIDRGDLRAFHSRVDGFPSSAFMNLFNLPKGLSSPLPFAEVIAKARCEKRWLIVNIQDNENFVSHSLNR